MSTQSSRIARDLKIFSLSFVIPVLWLAWPSWAEETCGGNPEECSGTFALCIAASCSSDFTSCPASYTNKNAQCTLCGANPPSPQANGSIGYCYIFLAPAESCLYPDASVGPTSCSQVKAHMPTAVYSTYSPTLLNNYGFKNLTCEVGGSADCMGATCTPTGNYVELYNQTTKQTDKIQTATCTCIVSSKGPTTGTTQGGDSNPKNCTGTVWSTF